VERKTPQVHCAFPVFHIDALGKMFASRDMPVLLPSKCTENFPLPVLFNSVAGKTMKKLLLIAMVAGGLTVAAAPRSDAQVFFSIGFGPGYYGYYPYGHYYPYRYYYRPY